MGQGQVRHRRPAQDIFLEYWWPDYADPYSWFVNLLESEKQPYFNLSYYSNPRLDKQINQVETLVATNRGGRHSCTGRCRGRSCSRRRSCSCTTYNYQYAMTSNISGFQVNPAYPNVIFVYNLKPWPVPVYRRAAGSRWRWWWSWASSW